MFFSETQCTTAVSSLSVSLHCFHCWIKGRQIRIHAAVGIKAFPILQKSWQFVFKVPTWHLEQDCRQIYSMIALSVTR